MDKFYLTYSGPGKVDIAGLGPFNEGTTKEVSERVANDFRNLTYWQVTQPTSTPEQAVDDAVDDAIKAVESPPQDKAIKRSSVKDKGKSTTTEDDE